MGALACLAPISLLAWERCERAFEQHADVCLRMCRCGPFILNGAGAQKTANKPFPTSKFWVSVCSNGQSIKQYKKSKQYHVPHGHVNCIPQPAPGTAPSLANEGPAEKLRTVLDWRALLCEHNHTLAITDMPLIERKKWLNNNNFYFRAIERIRRLKHQMQEHHGYKKIVALLMIAWPETGNGQYKPVDNGSSIQFTIKNFGIGTGGSFSGLKGDIKFDINDLAGSSLMWALMQYREHRKQDTRYPFEAEAYFDVKLSAYRLCLYKSKPIQQSRRAVRLRETHYQNQTKDISFPFTEEPNGNGYLFKGTFNIDRKDFGIGAQALSQITWRYIEHIVNK